ncbi:MAG: stage II sporulation protein M [Candidatus Thorarchaeota archaeon]|nr:MAG: stage II sporulation protein M [Candidatus Thorarchaeota archaeon]
MNLSRRKEFIQMVVITPMTVLFQLIPPLVVTIVYLIFFGKRRNKFVEAFIALMFIRLVSFSFFAIWDGFDNVDSSFDPTLNSNSFFGVVMTEFMFQFVSALQDFLTWVMVSLIAVFFGMGVLAIKLRLQDPLKVRFSNLIRSITRREPETDGYASFGDRLDHITFEGVDMNPLDNIDVRQRTGAWKDYLIIGLATLLPSIGVYLEAGLYRTGSGLWSLNAYINTVLIFLTWIYRFGYASSNRIAKGAGLKLGDRDLGSEMMRGVLGWFFRLNLILTVIFLIRDFGFWEFWHPAYPDILVYYTRGLYFAFWPIVMAILILPLTEDFAVVLYKRTFDALRRARQKISTTSWVAAVRSFVASVSVGAVATAAFVGAVMGVTLHYAWVNAFRLDIYPGQVAIDVITDLLNPAINSESMFTAKVWTLMMLLIPFGTMILTGVLGHLARIQAKGSVEGFAFFAGLTVSVATWILLPGMDYIVNTAPTPGTVDGILFYSLRTIISIPPPGEYLARLAAQFIVNMPVYIFTALFVMYYLDFRRKESKMMIEAPEIPAPPPIEIPSEVDYEFDEDVLVEAPEELIVPDVPEPPATVVSVEEEFGLNLKAGDFGDALLMFLMGLVGSVVAVLIIFTAFPQLDIEAIIWTLLAEIGDPNGLEQVLRFFVETELATSFLILAEHNIVRTFVMMFFGPLFWSALLWYGADKEKSQSDRRLGSASLGIVVILIAMSFAWTYLDMWAGVFVPSTNPWFNPWTFSAELGYRAMVLFGIFFAACILMAVYRWVSGNGVGGLWFPLVLTFFAMEYFAYDDQFTIIALVVLPFIIAGLSKAFGSAEARKEDFLLAYVRFSLMAIAIAEVLSTALFIGGISVIYYMSGANIMTFLSSILPHAIVEIPAFLIAASVSLRIARNLAPDVRTESWDAIPAKTRTLLGDERTWRAFALIVFFLLVSALIEAYITPIVWFMFGGPIPPFP